MKKITLFIGILIGSLSFSLSSHANGTNQCTSDPESQDCEKLYTAYKAACLAEESAERRGSGAEAETIHLLRVDAQYFTQCFQGAGQCVEVETDLNQCTSRGMCEN